MYGSSSYGNRSLQNTSRPKSKNRSNAGKEIHACWFYVHSGEKLSIHFCPILKLVCAFVFRMYDFRRKRYKKYFEKCLIFPSFSNKISKVIQNKQDKNEIYNTVHGGGAI